MKTIPLEGRAFQENPGFGKQLRYELGAWDEVWGDLYYAEKGKDGADAAILSNPAFGDRKGVFWARNIWLEPFRLEFDSISEAASVLRSIQRNWEPSLFTQFRRGALISEKLPPLSRKPRPFPWLLPEQPMGSWTLLDAHTLIASPRCTSPFPAGVVEFQEDKEGPPSRAYLKLWEALVRSRKWPLKGERCLDAGASPGGWTWALAKLGATVIAVDRAPLEDRVLAMKGEDGRPLVNFIKHDAFTLKPEDVGPVDWVFCDVICYPNRLYKWIEEWLSSGLCGNFVCTIKMQAVKDAARPTQEDVINGGPAVDYEGIEIARKLAGISGTSVMHLWHNKHELTWIKTPAHPAITGD
jgi:23S rRNA (cytidine2498-2'-O)-methyltransferase